MNDDASGLLAAQWNRFNRNFKQPDSEDAQRIAAEVRSSMDDWITSSLNDLATTMNSGLTQATQNLQSQLNASQQSLKAAADNLNTQLTTLTTALTAGAAAPDPKPLTDAIKSVQDAVNEIQAQWQKAGSDAVTTVTGIASNVIGLVPK